MTLYVGEARAWARIDSVYIGRTYAGMLEGLPTKEQNDRQIESLKQFAVKKVGCGPFGDSGEKVYGVRAEPVLVEPVRKPPKVMGGIDRLPEHMKKHYKNPEQLPDYYVFAMLDGTATDKKFCGAMALVIFFIDRLDQDVEEVVAEACRNLVWDDIAFNYDV